MLLSVYYHSADEFTGYDPPSLSTRSLKSTIHSTPLSFQSHSEGQRELKGAYCNQRVAVFTCERLTACIMYLTERLNKVNK